MEKYMLNILASLGKRSQLIESCNYFHLKGHFIYTSYLFFFFFGYTSYLLIKQTYLENLTECIQINS